MGRGLKMLGRNPDLGQHLWSTGLADKKLLLVGADFQTIADAPKKTRDVSFHLTLGEDRYCGTLNTRQRIQTILLLTAAESPPVIEGRLAKSTVVGQGGERYRLIIGTLKHISGP
jgi:hypothetical protein